MAELEDRLAADFGFLKDRVAGILLFGSAAAGKPARDLDICIVAGPLEPGPLLFEVFRRVDVCGKGYDVWIFEELPLHVQREVLGNHRVVLSRDEPALFEYLRPYRKRGEELQRRRRAAR